MSGGVSWETLTWVIGSNAVILGIAWRVLSWVNGQFKDRDLRIEAALALARMTEEAAKKEVNDFKVHVAERYATKDGVGEGFKRVEKSVDEVKELLNKLLIEERRAREG